MFFPERVEGSGHVDGHPSKESGGSRRRGPAAGEGRRAFYLAVFGLLAGCFGLGETEGERLSRQAAEASRYLLRTAATARKRELTSRLRVKAVEAYFTGRREYRSHAEEWRRQRKMRRLWVGVSWFGAASFLAVGVQQRRRRFG